MAKIASKVTKSLQETVASHPNIAEVHFTAEGQHHFNVHEHKSADKKDGLSGLYGRIQKKNVVTKDGVKIEIATPIINTKIVESASREDILKAEAESDLMLHPSLLNGLSAEEQAYIKKLRAGKQVK